MKGLILYYSGSGNTKVACQYISKNLDNVEVELVDIVKSKEIPNFENYDIVGFATFTDFFNPPYLFEQFVQGLPDQNDKLAFVFSTFGNIAGKALFNMKKQVSAKGFKVAAGFAFKVPESYPPAVVRGIGDQNNPKEEHLNEFKLFVQKLNEILRSPVDVGEAKIKKGGIFGLLFGSMKRTYARKDMGEKFVDESLCTECGICEKSCPYNAIILAPKPQFDMEKCYGCWYCYNHCPEKAIYTKKIRGEGHYPKANKQFVTKLKT